MKRRIVAVIALLLVGFLLAAASDCVSASPQDQARTEAKEHAEEAEYYLPKNDLERKNYNRRQQVADDPTTILWCTSAFPIPSSPLFTVPVEGKLTSGNKRPYQTQYTGSYYPEIPGPDGMYGESSDYRYGFTPAGIYADWYGMAVFCTTEPMIWQRESTTIVMESDPALLEAHTKAREALQRGEPEKARQILEEAVRKIQGVTTPQPAQKG